MYTAKSNEQVVGAGGDTIWIGSADTFPSVEVDTSANDSVIAYSGADTIVAAHPGLTTVDVDNALVTVEASGSAAVSVGFDPWTGGKLDFINNSSHAATVKSSYANGQNGPYASNSVTVFGGTGGGLFYGGHGGHNLLTGQSGNVTLVGANVNDVLSVSGGNGDVLYSGPGQETLEAGAGSSNDTFFLNESNPSLSNITGQDLVVSKGSGVQAFVMGAGFSTITGSQAAGAFNIFDLVRGASIGSANYTITNFGKANDVMFITDKTLTAGNSQVEGIQTLGGDTTVTLEDQSTIRFVGMSASQVHVSSLANGVIAITHS
jgi:hypothetical protein